MTLDHETDTKRARFRRLDDTITRPVQIEPDQDVDFPRHTPFRISEFFGSSREIGPGPQAFLVHSPPHSRTRAHFHPVSQYQIFFASPGAMYRRRPVHTPMLHYADACVTYGPLATTADGAQHFTLRPTHVVGADYMPGARDRATRRGSRHLHHDLGDISTATGEARSVEPTVIIPRQADHLAAWLYRLPAGGSVRLPDPALSGGQYACVLDGDLSCEADSYGRLSLAWSDPTSDRLAGVAGQRGCVVLVVHFPRESGADAQTELQLT